MPYIQPNILLTPTEKLIKPYECSFIVIEGPNMKGKLNLEGLEIKYESFYISQLILNQNAKDQPLIYGFLGENVTFLMIRAKYMPLDPNWAIETEQYIQYYYADDPTRIRTMSQLQILTGNSTHRIPQIYFNNPSSSYKVYIEILAANLAQSDMATTTLGQYAPTGLFNNLYYNSIISDVVNYTIPTSTGSTELKVLDSDGVTVVMVIPYKNIRTITKTDTVTLLLGMDTEEKVKLEFLSPFYCDQANSRINWVLKNKNNEILTVNYPPMDTTPPDFIWNDVLSGITTGITSGVTTVYLLSSGTTYTTTSLKEIFLSGITDNRDGIMSIYDAQVDMFELNDIVPATGITNLGFYNVLFTIKDLANNWTTSQKYVSIYTTQDNLIDAGYWDDDGVWIDIDIWFN